MSISKFWLKKNTVSLHEASYLVCGLEPDNSCHRKTVPNMVIHALDEMCNHIKELQPANPVRNSTTYQVPLNFVREWANHYGETDFFKSEPAKIDKPLTDNERQKLHKQIAAIALVLAEKSKKYQKGTKPNALQIADAVQSILDAVDFPGKKGTGSTELRNSISEGIKLLSNDD